MSGVASYHGPTRYYGVPLVQKNNLQDILDMREYLQAGGVELKPLPAGLKEDEPLFLPRPPQLPGWCLSYLRVYMLVYTNLCYRPHLQTAMHMSVYMSTCLHKSLHTCLGTRIRMATHTMPTLLAGRQDDGALAPTRSS